MTRVIGLLFCLTLSLIQGLCLTGYGEEKEETGPKLPTVSEKDKEVTALFAVIRDDKWGYIDRTGKYIWEPSR
ncbi:MAG: hypothetical protein QME51_02565 [Planctomycetota bacterium]|nr:hypothetical protein [Planctomycetota bacterium]MDI6787238.1 hypothetical protein [Planctomycetota bacterium]